MLGGRYAHPRSVCPRTMRPGEGGEYTQSGESSTGGAQRGHEHAAELLRNADQWVRLPVSQLLSLTNARTDSREVNQGSNNIAANRRENWQSLAPRAAYHQRRGMARHDDEPT